MPSNSTAIRLPFSTSPERAAAISNLASSSLSDTCTRSPLLRFTSHKGVAVFPATGSAPCSR